MRSDFTIIASDSKFDVRSSAPLIGLAGQGFIIGHLFSRLTLGQRVLHLNEGEIAEIVRTSGRSLISKFWGGYVAILKGPDGRYILVRDPSGIMPCYWRPSDGQIIASNDIQNVACWGAPASVDFPRLAQYLASPGYSGSETGLIGVSELVAGTSVTMTAHGPQVATLWSPWDFVFHTKYANIKEAAENLREVATKCAEAWAGCFENVILGVSGGLDSSIVAASAAGTTRLRCLNMYSNDAVGDERPYADILARKLGLPLETGHFDIGEIDIHAPVIPHRPWPNSSFFALGIEARHRRMNDVDPVGAYFSGNGGDNIFCSLRSTSPFLDRLFSEGPGFGIKTTLRDLCILTETDAATVLKTAWRQYMKLRKPALPKTDASGLSSKAASKVPLQHPWKTPPAHALPGKMGHVGALADAQQSHELYGLNSHAQHISVLLSQPIVELCLSIPTWYWVEGGKNRAVARKAFESILPDELLRRSSKGGPGGFMQEIYRTNLDAIKSIVRGGQLASLGLIDISYVDAVDDPSWRGTSRRQRLLQLAAAENWGRYWNGRPAAVLS